MIQALVRSEHPIVGATIMPGFFTVTLRNLEGPWLP